MSKDFFSQVEQLINTIAFVGVYVAMDLKYKNLKKEMYVSKSRTKVKIAKEKN